MTEPNKTDHAAEDETPALDYKTLRTLATTTLHALHQLRAEQTVNYQLAQPLDGPQKTAIVFLPPTFQELQTLREALMLAAQAEGKAIIESMAEVIADVALAQKVLDDSAQSDATTKAITEAFAALERSIEKRWS